jgi:autotransporter-associated beta strand protein
LNIIGETLLLAGGTLDSSGSSNFWSGDVALANLSIINVATNSTLNLAGGIGGTGGLIKNGDGTLIFSGNKNNSYVGATTINQGILLLSKTVSNALSGALTIGDGTGGVNTDVVRFIGDSQIGNGSAVTINSSGQLDLNGFSGPIGSLTMTSGNVTTGAGV